MATLREEILALRCVSETGQNGTTSTPQDKFIPQQSLYRLLRKGKVLKAVNEINETHLEWHLKERTVDWIVENGRLIFGILVVLEHKEFISVFTEQNLFDEKLPFTEGFLDAMVPSIAKDFYKQQWEFTAPKLARDVLHRVLHPKCRMPFIHNEPLDKGGFGEIYKIIVHPDHQTIPLLPEGPDQGMVRKEFKVLWRSGKIREDEVDHKNELRCLSILNELKHPNIIQMLASYTHNDKHNLLFPLVQNGNLEKLMRGGRPEQFRLDETFLTALCELSSAIKEVHFYTLARLKIEMIGFHHDLKPQNILVRESSFVLADFGLSKLKEASESPKSMYEGGGDVYLAPECEDCDDGFERHSISRSSDIWSFGCIIAEILTFIRKGADGLQNFRAMRKVKIGGERMAAFHAGIRTPNQAALAWISGLKDEPGNFSGLLVELILPMLHIQPEGRPDARAVASRLRFIAVRAHSSLVSGLYDKLVTKLPNSFDAFSEWARFKSWTTVFYDAASDDDRWSQKLDAQMDLMSIIRCLANVREELDSTISRCEYALSPLFTTLRLLSNELFGLLPKSMQMQAKAQWEMEMLSSEELDMLEETAKAFEDSLADNRISIIARIKRMTIEAAKHGNEDDGGLEIDSRLYEAVGTCGHHTLALLRSEADDSERRVFIEWIKYSNHETDNFPRLLSRIKALASLLHSFPCPDDFRTLRCSAFTHDRGECAFGLIYDFPTQSSPLTAPKTLAKIISETSKIRERPTFESRLRLARTLALSLAGFHNAGWLHKSISPYNILFFIATGSRAATWVEQPYLTGFNHSRQDDPLAFTAGPTSDEVASRYYHPDYCQMRGHQVWYRPEFDYYSLGLVLLEIGLWTTLEELGKRDTFSSNEGMLEVLRRKRVPLLGHYMGSNYQEAVMACLDGLGRGTRDETQDDGRALRLEFGRRVIEPLRRWVI